MKAYEIIDIIERTAPLGLSYSWDNSGLLVGDKDKEVKKVYLTLDVNMYTVDEAVSVGADMIISHHPIMFGGIKKIDYSSPQGYVIKQLILNDITLYASHIPTDTAKGGINDALAEKLNLRDIKIIEPSEEYPGCGLGRVGFTEKTISLDEFAQRVKSVLNTPFVRVIGNGDIKINCVAVGGGACDDLIPKAKKMGADVMLTADMKYHISMDSAESGIAVVDAGHFPTEVFVTDIFEKLLKGTDIEIIKSTERDVFRVV